MKKILVTGATGFIGTPLCVRLADSGYHVVALRHHGSISRDLQRKEIQIIRCDITSLGDLQAAFSECEYCFHLAALAKPWSPDRNEFYRVNVDGTRNVLTAALRANVKRVVFTSSASVFGPADQQNPATETHSIAQRLDSAYEQSKMECESVVEESQAKGLDVVTVYPSRVYGPGASNPASSLTQIFQQFMEGRWRMIPGDGNAVGNYVFIEDVVLGHIAAMIAGHQNARYLLGGENLSFNQVVDQLRRATGSKHRLCKIPKSILIMLANFELLKTRIIGSTPRITVPFVKKYLRNWHVDDSKARSEIGYAPITFAAGLDKTIQWLLSQ